MARPRTPESQLNPSLAIVDHPAKQVQFHFLTVWAVPTKKDVAPNEWDEIDV